MTVDGVSHSMELLTVLGLSGLPLPILHAIRLRRRSVRSLRIEAKVVRQAVFWTVIGGLWSGIFAAWLVTYVIGQGEFLAIPIVGRIAAWLGIPIACALLMLGGLLLELAQLHLFTLPVARNRAESKAQNRDQQ